MALQVAGPPAGVSLEVQEVVIVALGIYHQEQVLKNLRQNEGMHQKLEETTQHHVVVVGCRWEEVVDVVDGTEHKCEGYHNVQETLAAGDKKLFCHMCSLSSEWIALGPASGISWSNSVEVVTEFLCCYLDSSLLVNIGLQDYVNFFEFWKISSASLCVF